MTQHPAAPSGDGEDPTTPLAQTTGGQHPEPRTVSAYDLPAPDVTAAPPASVPARAGRTRVLLAGAAAALVLVAGVGGFAIGRGTADAGAGSGQTAVQDGGQVPGEGFGNGRPDFGTPPDGAFPDGTIPGDTDGDTDGDTT